MVCGAGEPRRAVICLWVGQLASGAILLSAGAETLAVLLWVASTLVAAVYFFHADLLGASADAPSAQGVRRMATRTVHGMASVGVGLVVWWLMELALVGPSVPKPDGAPGPGIGAPADFDERFVLVELLAGLSLAAVVAAGVVTRAGGVERNSDLRGKP